LTESLTPAYFSATLKEVQLKLAATQEKLKKPQETK
jgi:hypothetical protein